MKISLYKTIRWASASWLSCAVVILAMTLGVVACAQPAPEGSEEADPRPSAEGGIQDVLARNEAWFATINDEPSKVLAFYADGAFLATRWQAPTNDREQMMLHLESGRSGTTLELTEITQTETAGDRAAVFGRFSVNDTDGEVVGRGSFARIWTADEQGWMLDQDHWGHTLQEEPGQAGQTVEPAASAFVTAESSYLVCRFDDRCSIFQQGCQTNPDFSCCTLLDCPEEDPETGLCKRDPSAPPEYRPVCCSTCSIGKCVEGMCGN